MGKLLDEETFKHVDYHHTDVRKTFARVRKQMADAEAAKQEANRVVSPIKKKVQAK